MKLAMLGGSFNPVHVGHTALAKIAVEQYGYDKVIFVPAFNPPHKNLALGATNDDRCAMLSLSVANNSSLEIETCEIDREGTSYTIDTVTYLYEKYKDVLEGKIGLIIGEDLVDGFHLWKDVQSLINMTNIMVAFREGESTYKDFTIDFDFVMMKNALVNVSSREIRDAIKHKKDIDCYVSKSVAEYIQTKKLYI